MIENDHSIPSCYGKLENVFPMQADGLRRTPEPCLPCPHKTMCLKTAVAGRDGLKLAEEKVDRAYTAGNMGFWQRWHKKKTIARQKMKKG